MGRKRLNYQQHSWNPLGGMENGEIISYELSSHLENPLDNS
jgi:hypothetical protein